MARGAAIFDLDRTLLDGSSWPIYARALHTVGVLPERGIPGVESFFALFRSLGETYLSMQATKLAISRTRGWDLDAVDEAARLALEPLLAELHPWARLLIDEHHAAGRPLVLATTTPYRLAKPLSEALGFDACVATHYGITDNAFDGSIAGHFVWNRGKLAAVEEWADQQQLALADCHAYSDSFFDAPLLEAVGHPTAVNPDPRLALLARLRRWPVRWLDKPPGVPKVVGRELQELFRPFLHPALLPYARFELAGVEHLPRQGPVLLCANHRSYFDPTALSVLMARVGRSARFLGKKEVFDVPVLGRVTRALGGIRVDRGSGSDEPLDAAVQALRAGELVAIMPQGTIPRGPAFFEPELRGRFGAARLAALSQAPVVPVGLWGTEKVWPRSSRLPRLDVAHPPLVTVTVGAPVELGYEDPGEDTGRIMAAVAALLPPEARERRTPTDDELRLTYPPRYRGDTDEGANRTS